MSTKNSFLGEGEQKFFIDEKAVRAKRVGRKGLLWRAGLYSPLLSSCLAIWGRPLSVVGLCCNTRMAKGALFSSLPCQRGN